MRTLLVLPLFALIGFTYQDPLEYPLDFDKWDDVAKKAWEKGVEAATDELKEEAAKRLEAAAKALRGASAAGVDPAEAKKIVVEGMDAGFTTDDYKNLGQWVKAKHKEGLKGKALSDAIHDELGKRKAEKHGGGKPDLKPEKPPKGPKKP